MNIIVTGAARGIGKELCLQFASSNNKVIAVSRSIDRVKNFSKFPNVIPVKMDLREKDWSILMEAVQKDFNGNVDILINNAGILINKRVEVITQKEINETFEVNYFAPLRLIQTFLPALKQGNFGHIVNISSMGGYQGSAKFPGLSIYSSAKSAINNLSECLAEELRDSHVKVNSLSLGAVNTEMLHDAFPEYKAPLGADEMAEFIVYFSVHGCKFFNGKVIPVSLSTP